MKSPKRRGSAPHVYSYFFDQPRPPMALSDVMWKLAVNPDFKEEIEQVRTKLGIQIDEEELVDREGNDLSDEDKYHVYELATDRFLNDRRVWTEARKLAVKYKVPRRWIKSIVNEIIEVYGYHAYEPHDADRLLLRVSERKDSIEPDFALIINDRTTLAELRKCWPKISKKIKSHTPKALQRSRKPWKKMVRDYQIYDLGTQGKSVTQIARLIEKQFGEKLEYTNIKKIESAFRKKLGIGSATRRKYKIKLRDV